MKLRLSLLLLVCVTPFAASAADKRKPNVLFIAVDDLRPQIFSYGRENMMTPNIDRLAKRGTLFERAYCMVPTCGASRASLMSGVRPANNRFVNYLARADKDVPGVKTLNTHFKENGYHTVSLGKVFHAPADNAHGWSETPWRPKAPAYADAASMANARKRKGKSTRGLPYESGDVEDGFYADGKTTAKAIADLKRLSQNDQPFFLAVGFMKPHLPFVAPTRHWDKYPASEIHLPGNYHAPKDAPKESLHTFGELRAYADVPRKGALSDEMARDLIRGYYACVSYTDRNVGRLLDTLDKLGLRDNTVIVLWGDHGWNLGEHQLWCKHCCYETSMNAPLIISAPHLKFAQTGTRTRSLTEFVDIYPTLCELTGLDLPAHLEGNSALPVLRDPNAAVKSSAIGRYRQGDTIRTDRYRFTLYSDTKGKQIARMLYDHRADPGENINIAELPKHRKLVADLTQKLKQGMGKPSRRP
jgi:iduronate 2-sulfatase